MAEHDVPRRQARGGPAVDLHVETLVLDASFNGDRYRIAAGLEEELTHLLAAHAGDPVVSRTIAYLDAGRLPGPGTASGPQLGRAIGAAVHGALQTPLQG